MSISASEAAQRRVSIRRYTDNPIPRETLEAILHAAGNAPSAWNIQPWRVVVVTDPEVKEKLMGAAYGQKQVGAAAAVFVVYNDMPDALANPIEFLHPGMGDRREAEGQSIQANFEKMGAEKSTLWGHAQANIFLGYLLLMIEEWGLGSSPMLGFDPEQVKALLNIPAHATLPAIVAVGEKAEEGFSKFRHPVDRFVRFV